MFRDQTSSLKGTKKCEERNFRKKYFVMATYNGSQKFHKLSKFTFSKIDFPLPPH